MSGEAVADEQLVFGMLEAPELVATDQTRASGRKRIDCFASPSDGPEEVAANDPRSMQPVQTVVGAIDAPDASDNLDLFAVEDLGFGQLLEEIEVAGSGDDMDRIIPSH